MNKLSFSQVEHYEVDENLLFITWTDHFECFDYITDESQFKLDHSFWAYRIIENKLFAQKDNGSDLLVYDLKGKLLKKVTGQFYFFLETRDDQFLYFPGANEKNEHVGYKLDLETLTIAAELKHNSPASFVKGSIGIMTWGTAQCGYNINTGENIWEYDMGEGTYTAKDWCYLNDDYFILRDSRSRLTSLHIETGKIIWQKENNIHFHRMHPVNKNLYGLSRDANFEIINSKTGDIILNQDLPELKKQFDDGFLISSNKVYKDGLYFINNYGYKKFGKINIPGNDIAFVADIDAHKGPHLRRPSFPYNNCYFGFGFDQNLQVTRPLMK